jgi:peptide/nickel transport system substrate-binding protein
MYQRRRRHTLFVAPLLVVSLLATACSGSDSNSNSGNGGNGQADLFRIGVVGNDFSNIDPGKGFALQIDSYLMEFLMNVNSDGELVPGLAESMEQPDDVTYVYHLRPDVTFSNGDPLTADDVVTSLDHARNPKFSESWRYSAIKDITARDEQTVVVTLAKPTASFKYTLALNGYIFDAQHQADNEDTFGQPGTGVIGTGAYVLSKLDATNGKVELTANPDYWGGPPKIATVTLTGFADENSEALAFRTGEIDLAFPQDVRSFEAASGVDVTSVDGTRQGMFIMNTQVAPWDDVHVRRAVAYAINKDEIVDVVGGDATPDHTIIPPAQLRSIADQSEIDSLMESLPAYDYDLDKAKEEMSQSAYADGFSGVLQSANYGSYAATSQAIAGQLAEIGIDLDVKVLSEAAYTKTFSIPHSEVPVQYTYFNNNTPDAGGMPRLALDSSGTAVGLNNFADYVNPEVDDLIEQADGTTDPAEQFDAYSQLLAIVGDDVPYVPLYAGKISYAIADGFAWPEFGPYSTDHTPYLTQIEVK